MSKGDVENGKPYGLGLIRFPNGAKYVGEWKDSKYHGSKDNNMALDTYSAGLKIEPLVESINKLTYGKEIDSFIKSNEA